MSSKMDEVIEFLTEKGPMKKIVGGKRTVDAVTGPEPKKVKPKIHKHPPTVRAVLEITGSLLQDVTLPAIEDLGENIQLFFSGGNTAQPTDPIDQEVKDFLSGGK